MPARRIPGGKEPVSLDSLVPLLPEVLEEDQALLVKQSRERRESRTAEVCTFEEAVEAAAAGGWARIPWATLGEEGGSKPRRSRGDRTVSGRRGRVGAGRRRRTR
jgi:prolyl-tRNA synthetase